MEDDSWMVDDLLMSGDLRGFSVAQKASWCHINEKDLAEASLEKQKDLIERIPLALRDIYDISTSTEDLEELRQNAAKNAKHITDLVWDTKSEWIKITFRPPDETHGKSDEGKKRLRKRMTRKTKRRASHASAKRSTGPP